MSPYQINFLLHCFTSPSSYDESFAKKQTIEYFIELDLIEPQEDYFVCKERGLVYVEMLMTLALPEIVYIDPSNGEPVNIQNSYFGKNDKQKERE